MKVLFSNPPWWSYENGRLLRGIRAGSRWPLTEPAIRKPDRFYLEYVPYPYFLGYATTYVQRETDASVTFRDSIALSESYEKYYAHIKDNVYDYIFVESSTPTWEQDKQILRELKKLSPVSKLVVTGPIAALGEKLLCEAPIEALIQGEYEKGSVRVINGESGLIPFDFLTTEEMNAAPFPYYDFDHVYRYFESAAPPVLPMAMIRSNRGCPFKCIFCAWPATMTSNDPDGAGTRTVRYYTPEYMEAFLTELVKKYKIRHAYIDDDTFNLGDKHVLGICDVMRKLNIPWGAMCRVDTIKMNTWQVMRESGCRWIMIGYESGSQWVIDNIVNKNLDLENARDMTRKLREMGFFVHGTFTYGLPGETAEHVAETFAYRKSLHLDSFQEGGTSALEGTPLAKLLQSGSLGNYKGAQINDNFAHSTDGKAKLRKMKSQTAQHMIKNENEKRYGDEAVRGMLERFFKTEGPRLVAFISRARPLDAFDKPRSMIEIENLCAGILPRLAGFSPMLVTTAPLEDSPLIEADAGKLYDLYPLTLGRTPTDAVRKTSRCGALLEAIRNNADRTIVLGLGSGDFYLMLEEKLAGTHRWDIVSADLFYLNIQLAPHLEGRILLGDERLKQDVNFYYDKWGLGRDLADRIHLVPGKGDIASLLAGALRSLEDKHGH